MTISPIQSRATVRPLPPGAVGFDCAAKLTTSVCKAMREKGSYVYRYLSLSGGSVWPWRGDLDTAEIEAILGAGLALGCVQHGHSSGWTPSEAQGAQDGVVAVRHAHLLGLPRGMQGWHDLEAIAPTPADRIIACCNAWAEQVELADFISGQYVGVPCGLSGEQLYRALRTRAYWRSLSGSTPEVAGRGFVLRQYAGPTIHGIATDRNVAQTDSRGGAALVLAPEGWVP